jgi:methyl-accepting chemotaxis protein
MVKLALDQELKVQFESVIAAIDYEGTAVLAVATTIAGMPPVKALAGQTAKATQEISSQIAGMQSATQDSVAAIKEISGTIGRISEIASTIAAAVAKQGAATREISRNVQQAARGTTQVATNILEVNKGAAESGSAATQMLGSARTLAGESNRLSIEMEKFLSNVRAA